MEQQDAPLIYTHPTQPAWGRAVVQATHSDRRDFMFEDGKSRTFYTEKSPLVWVTVPADEAFAIDRALRGRKAPVPPKKQKGAAAKVARVTTMPTTFEQQLEVFVATFPKGFEDPKFLAQERGTGEVGKAPAMAMARESLARDVLERALAAGEFTAVHESAKALVRVTKTMLHPVSEGAEFQSAPPEAHEAFARALHALLWGAGSYAERFTAFVDAQPTKRPYWTATTLFSALVHPQDHVFVKPGVEQAQAAVLGLEPPPGGKPTHEGYALYLAVGTEVRTRLAAAGHQPRDLMDVYSFVGKTLSKSGKSGKPASPKSAPAA